MTSQDQARDELLERIERDQLVIPPVPTVYAELTALLLESDVGAREVADAVTKDPPLSGLVLRLANSARYGPSEKVVSVDRACVMVGARGLRNLVLQVGARRTFDHLHDRAASLLDAFWHHAVLTAQLCVRLGDACEYDHKVPSDLLYTCGLLHDLGLLVMLDALGDAYLEILDRARETGQPLFLVEREQRGYSHTEVGNLLGRRWDLPDEVVTAMGHHHDSQIQCLRHPWLSLTDIANRMASSLEHEKQPAAWTFLEPLAAQRMGLHVGRLKDLLDWGQQARAELLRGG